MDYYHSWLCEIATKDLYFAYHTLGIDYLSGCFYFDGSLIGTISGSTIEVMEDQACFTFTSSLDGEQCQVRFKTIDEMREVIAFRDRFMRSYWIPKNGGLSDNESSTPVVQSYQAQYQLKSREPPSFSYFTLYRTYNMMYIVAENDSVSNDEYHILKIQLSSSKQLEGSLEDSLVEDSRTYSRASLQVLLSTIHDGNKATGGLTRLTSAKAILGFVRFTRYYYLVIATETKPEGIIMGHIIYSILSYDIIPLTVDSTKSLFHSLLSGKSEMDDLEEKCLGLFNMVDLTKGFYFSYRYSLSHSVQHNILVEAHDCPSKPQEMFVWNSYLLSEFCQCVSSKWYCYLIHGVFLQQRCIQYSRQFQLTLIARRSRMYAGPRYLKRGINDDGYVANEVEVETIIEDEDGHICSHIQLRGSIPGYWKQDVSVAVPRPPIQIVLNDPLCRTFSKHLSLLLQRYSAPIQVFDLVKMKEKHPRESLVCDLLRESCSFVNKQMPTGMKITYWHIDFADIAKRSSVENPLLHDILLYHSRMSLDSTSFFASYISPEVHRRVMRENESSDDEVKNGSKIEGLTNAFRMSLLENHHLEQRGVMRSNCIDCLDRTNVAQFFLSFTVVYRMLFTLGIEYSPAVPESSSLQQLLVELYKELGDVISLQYGGSNAHNKIEITKGNKKRKELFTTILRHYNNTFTDKVKQEAMNVFLGVFIPTKHASLNYANNGKTTYDYYLHNRGYSYDDTVRITPPEKWWFLPLLAYEQSINGDPWNPLRSRTSTDRCPCCGKKPPIAHTLLCAYCGALLCHSLPAISQDLYYSHCNERGLVWEQLIESDASRSPCELDKLLALPCFQPHYLSPMADEGDAGVPVTVFRSWENWNTRTHSTVQYVGLDDGKKPKSNQDGEDDEDEDEIDTDNRALVRRSSQFRTPITGEEKEQDRSEMTGEEELHLSVRDQIAPSTSSLPSPGQVTIRGSVSLQPRSIRLDDYWRISDKVSEYCVFPSRRNIALHDLIQYESYHSFYDGLKKTAVQPVSEYQCADRDQYKEYLTSSRLDDVIDPGSCALEQQEMHALYHVTLNDEVYNGSVSGCVMIDLMEKEEELKLLKSYLEVTTTNPC